MELKYKEQIIQVDLNAIKEEDIFLLDELENTIIIDRSDINE